MNRRLLLPFVLPFAAAVSAQTAGLTQQLNKTVQFDDVAVSPDGNRTAWVQSVATSSDSTTTISDGKNAPVAVATKPGSRSDASPAWAPDSRTLAFFSTVGEKEQAQLWTVAADGKNARKRTTLKGYAARPHWSHDGTRIAFLYIEGASGGGPLLAAPTQTGVIDDSFKNQRIAILDVATGKLSQVSPRNLHVYAFDWSPDDKAFAVTAAPGPGDNNWWIARLHVVAIATGQAKEVYKPQLQLATPRWSPDGKTVAFIEGIMSDEGFHGGDVFTVSATGGAAVNHTKGRKSSPGGLLWIKQDRILLTESVGGGSAISELIVANNEVRTLWNGAEDVHTGGNFPNFSVSKDGSQSAVARSTFTKPPEIWTGPIGQWKQLTQANAAMKPSWGEGQNLEWTNQGFHVQGWLIPPVNVQPAKKYPMVVNIHGGPAGVAKPAWPVQGFAALLASQGYYVFLPNPRGSYGQGEEFTKANVKDFGYGDLRDIMAGVDHAIGKFPIDNNRLGVTGWSYGGFMTMWTVTQTNRFKAAMAGAGIANWESYYGQNLIDQWMIPYFGASVYDDPSVYAKSSPLSFIKKVTTPTLVIVGEFDAECPAPQSYEFWHAMRALGKTTELVVYKGEGHRFMDPKNRVDMQDRTVRWFQKYLK